MRSKEFCLRRKELLKRLGGDSVAIISAAKKHGRGVEDSPYRQDGDFYYLTGCIDPGLIVVLIPGRSEGEVVLFCHESDPAKELWDGGRICREKACGELGVDQAFSLAEIDDLLPQLLAEKDSIYFNLDFDHDFVQQIVFWLNQARSKISKSIRLPHKLVQLGNVLHEMRLIKSQSEIAIIRQAANITMQGHLRAMQKCKPGMYEFELEAELLYGFHILGGRRKSFDPIVAGGANACTLHYPHKNNKLLSGELVLIDAGVEYEHYCADVSRTFPVNGSFTLEQRAVYEVVLNAQLEVIKCIRPGVGMDVLQATAERIITEGLVAIGLLKGRVEDLLLRQECNKQFFVHKIGHWLGLDVHDVGKYMVDDKPRIFEAGMIFTVEPGVYIRPNSPSVASKWFGIGVRIEDNILVTDGGCEVLTESLPKTIGEIEQVMKTGV